CFFQGTGPGSDKGNAAILDGKYVIEEDRAKNLKPGSYTVQIFWQRKKGAGNRAQADASPAVEQLIPDKYNTKSTLTRDITSGANKLDFSSRPNKIHSVRASCQLAPFRRTASCLLAATGFRRCVMKRLRPCLLLAALLGSALAPLVAAEKEKVLFSEKF